MPSAYQIEQIETFNQVFRHIRQLDSHARQHLKEICNEYLLFRKDVNRFLIRYFSDICTKQCYENQRSACCSREGIITFFADVVINVLFSEKPQIELLLAVLQTEGRVGKCIYLGDSGCLWQIKPIVCEMFLCNRAKATVFDPGPEIQKQWEHLETFRKQFTWPDKPVLFDDLERIFMDAGLSSPLMYFHNSPGLLKVRRMARQIRMKG